MRLGSHITRYGSSDDVLGALWRSTEICRSQKNLSPLRCQHVDLRAVTRTGDDLRTMTLQIRRRPAHGRLAATSIFVVALGLEACSGSEDPSTSGPAGVGGASSNGGITGATPGGTGEREPTNGGSGGATSSTAVAAQGGATGGSTTIGGSSATGGALATGGTSASTAGGTPAAGGIQTSGGKTTAGGGTNSGGAVSGGATAAGGTSHRGGGTSAGGVSTGGTASGGTSVTGGVTSTGGIATGGAKATGGTASGGAATGGVPSTGTPDCNSVTGQTVINVAADGSGSYTTVQAAINSVATSNTTPTQIRIKPGTYKEKLTINRAYITLCGQAGKASTTILTYSDNANTSNGSGGTLGTSGSASTNLSASNVSAENVTFENSTALGGSQAVALLVTGSRVQFRNCRFLSYQDTLYTKSGTQYFKNCYIQGSVDYIFGGATAVFDSCTVHNASGGVSATAPSTDQATAYGLVFLGGQLTAASSVSANSVALGRNWGAYGAAAYIKTALGAHISGVGWQAMGSNTLATARFSEYQTTGAGATATKISQRASQSKQLTAAEAAAYTVNNIFGSWIPTFSQ